MRIELRKILISRCRCRSEAKSSAATHVPWPATHRLHSPKTKQTAAKLATVICGDVEGEPLLDAVRVWRAVDHCGRRLFCCWRYKGGSGSEGSDEENVFALDVAAHSVDGLLSSSYNTQTNR